MTPKAVVLLCLLLAAPIVLVSAAPVSASPGTVTFTSTADFDAGTKSQPSPADGNYQVETNTDNLGIAAGGFELASLEGDSFTLADADADTFKWNKYQHLGDGGDSYSVAGGELQMSWSSQAGTESASVSTGTAISGDHDIRIKVETVDEGSWFMLRDLDSPTLDYSSAGQDGYFYVRYPAFFTVYRVVNGLVTQVGTSTANTAGATYWLRITRATNTWTFYYSTDGSVWTQDEQETYLSQPSALYPGFETAHSNLDAVRYDLDDFYVAAGTVDSGGYRTSGSWTSATQTWVAEVPQTVTLTYSGVSAANYIDAVSIRDASGNEIWSDGTDITSGTSADVAIPDNANLEQNWTVRVTLAGNGAGTPTIESVVVTTGPRPGSPPSDSGSRVLRMRASCTYIAVALHWTCADVTDYKGFQGVLRVEWRLDGALAATSAPSGRVLIRAAGETWARPGGDHILVVTAILANGGKPMTSYILTADNRPGWAIFALIAALIAAAAARGAGSRRDGRIFWESIPSSYRSAIRVDEYPRGWRAYRQAEPRHDLPTRSVRRGDLWVIYQVRPATAGEQARTGKKRIAYVQTVREKM